MYTDELASYQGIAGKDHYQFRDTFWCYSTATLCPTEC